jgi:hypothetical protein
MADVLGRTSRGSPRGCGVEVIDVDDHAALATEGDHLVVKNHVVRPHNPASGMQGLMEVVHTHRRVDPRPQLLDENITMNPMASRKRQQLDDRPCLPQPPPWRPDNALDAHREAAQQGDSHGSARVAHPRMLTAPIDPGNPKRSSTDDAGNRDRWTISRLLHIDPPRHDRSSVARSIWSERVSLAYGIDLGMRGVPPRSPSPARPGATSAAGKDRRAGFASVDVPQAPQAGERHRPLPRQGKKRRNIR